MHSGMRRTRNAFYTSRYLFIKYHHLEQGHGTTLEGNTPTADTSHAHRALHHTGLKGGSSAKCRTSSVPLSQMVPF